MCTRARAPARPADTVYGKRSRDTNLDYGRVFKCHSEKLVARRSHLIPHHRGDRATYLSLREAET